MMTLSARTIAALLLAGWMLSLLMPMAAAAQPRGATGSAPNATGSAPIFKIETDEFWLNLHHFLYVLGRAESKEGNASREAVAGAPSDAAKGLASPSLKDDERQAWRAAVTAYANGLSKKDAIFDAPLPALTAALARAGDGDAKTLANHAAIDAATRATLEGVAPIYRHVWWPAHRASNQAWASATQSLVDRHGRAIVDFLTKAYGQPWPAGGYPVHVSMYANWAGAYSTDGPTLVIATNPGAGTSGVNGLEMAFHEAMHVWDDGMMATIREQARANSLPEPENLFHALIFFTAGEAVKRVVPAHTPYAEGSGVWKRGMAPLKGPIEEAWKPYLDGPALGDTKARDAAILAVVKKVPLPATPPSGR